jgi:hypothetical protein
MKKISITNYNWIWFSQGYINSTIILLNTLLENQQIPNKPTDNLWLPSSDIQYITIPIFYNIRHSLELIIKTTEVFKDTPTSKIFKTHDNRTLTEALIKTYGTDDKIAGEFISIARKYYNEEFYKNNFSKCSLPDDPMNTLFRFPEKKGEISYIDPTIFSKINKTLVSEIKIDVERLNILLYKFYGKHREPFYASLDAKLN